MLCWAIFFELRQAQRNIGFLLYSHELLSQTNAVSSRELQIRSHRTARTGIRFCEGLLL